MKAQKYSIVGDIGFILHRFFSAFQKFLVMHLISVVPLVEYLDTMSSFTSNISLGRGWLSIFLKYDWCIWHKMGSRSVHKFGSW